MLPLLLLAWWVHSGREKKSFVNPGSRSLGSSGRTNPGARFVDFNTILSQCLFGLKTDTAVPGSSCVEGGCAATPREGGCS